MAPNDRSADGPREPSAASRAAARAIRDLFDGLMAEGFTERQAIAIVGQMLAANTGNDAAE